MMEKIKTRVGTMACERIKCESHLEKPPRPVVVFANEKGTLSYKCDYCGRNPYAQEGSNQKQDWMEMITFFAPAQPDRKPAEQKPTEPAAPVKTPVAAKKRPLF